jgi:hypothetical protein
MVFWQNVDGRFLLLPRKKLSHSQHEYDLSPMNGPRSQAYDSLTVTIPWPRFVNCKRKLRVTAEGSVLDNRNSYNAKISVVVEPYYI